MKLIIRYEFIEHESPKPKDSRALFTAEEYELKVNLFNLPRKDSDTMFQCLHTEITLLIEKFMHDCFEFVEGSWKCRT